MGLAMESTQPFAGQDSEFASIVRRGFAFVQRAAQRLVALREEEWAMLERSMLQMKEASEDERLEIIETMLEIVLPDVLIGGVVNPERLRPSEGKDTELQYRRRIGEQIRQRRRAMRMTQAVLAKKAGLPQSHVSRLERGKHFPTDLTIERLAKALKTSPEQLDPGHPET